MDCSRLCTLPSWCTIPNWCRCTLPGWCTCTLPAWCTVPDWIRRTNWLHFFFFPLAAMSFRERFFYYSFVVFLTIDFALFLVYVEHYERFCVSPQCLEASNYIISSVDRNVQPCDGFYDFTCRYPKIDQDTDLPNVIEMVAKQLVMEDRKNEEKLTKSFKAQRKYFRTCMNTTAIDNDKDKTFINELGFIIPGWPHYGVTREDFLPKVTAAVKQKGFQLNFFLSLDIVSDLGNGFGTLEITPAEPPSKYLWKDKNIDIIRNISRHWGGRGLSYDDANGTIQFAKELTRILVKAHDLTVPERKIAVATMGSVRFLEVNWLQFLRNITGLRTLKPSEVINFSVDAETLEELHNFIWQTEIKYVSHYVALEIVANECIYLSRKMRTLCMKLQAPETKLLERTDYCLNQSLSFFPGVAEVQYTRDMLTKEKRDHITEMVANIKEEMRKFLQDSEFIDQKIKTTALNHLNNITVIIGWKDPIFNETEFERLFEFIKDDLLSENIVQMSHEINRFYLKFKFEMLYAPLSFHARYSTRFPLLKVSAYYAHHWDEFGTIALPAPLLTYPIYDANRPEYMNYGALGFIIGHELTHVINRDVSYDQLDLTASCLNEEYQKYIQARPGLNINGSDYLSEYIADFTGMNMAYKAYLRWIRRYGHEKQLTGLKYTPKQVFWIMAGTTACLYPDQPYDTHNISSFRAIGPMRNSKNFAYDFNCVYGTDMNPVKQCRSFG